MISVRQEIFGVEESITVPVYTKVLKDVLEKMLLPVDLRQDLTFESIDYKKDNWILTGSDKSKLFGPVEEFIAGSIETEYGEESPISSAVHSPTRPPVIDDNVSGLKATPLSTDITIRMECVYFTKSKTSIDGFLSRLRRLAARDESMAMHKVNYIYYPPKLIFRLIEEIRNIRAGSKDAHDTLESYLNAHSKATFSVVNNLSLADEKASVVITENQSGIVGRFISELINPKRTYDNDTGYWATDFTYEFTFYRPDAMSIQYNHVVRNKLISPNLTNALIGNCKKLNEIRLGINAEVFKHFSTEMNGGVIDGNRPDFMDANSEENIDYLVKARRTYVNIPCLDIHDPIDDIPHHKIVFSVLTTITDEDKTTLFNLNDLGDFELAQSIKNYIASTGNEDITNYLKSIFYIELRANNEPMDDAKLYINKNLDVMAVGDLDMEKTYRVFFHVLIDSTMLGRVNRYKTEELISLFKTYQEILFLVDPENPNKIYTIPTLYKLENGNWSRHRLHPNLVITSAALTHKGD